MKKTAAAAVLLLSITVSVYALTGLLKQQDVKVTAFNRSIKLEENKDYRQALQELTKIYNSNKDNYLINLRLGWLYYNLNDHANSLKYYNNSISQNYRSIEALLGSTLPLAAQNNWEEVKKRYNRVLTLDAANYTAGLRLGQIFLNAGNYTKAKEYLEKVYSLYPGEYEPNLSLGYTYYYLGDKNKARQLFTAALMIVPDDSLAAAGLKLTEQ